MTAVSATHTFALAHARIAALPDALHVTIFKVLVDLEPQLLARMRAGVPTRNGPRPANFARSRPGAPRPSGGLVSLLTTTVELDQLRLTGGLLTKAAVADGFYGYILDAGRGLKHTRSKPRRRLIAHPAVGKRGRPRKWTVRYSRAISPIAPDRYDITFGRVREWARGIAGPQLIVAYKAALVAVRWGAA